MKTKEALVWTTLTFALFLGLFFLGRYELSSTNPPFLIPRFEALMNNNKLMDSIGGYTGSDLNFSQIEFQSKDTLRSTIKITGKKKVLLYNALHIRKEKGVNEWILTDEKLIIE